jgi:hypothetical protein
MTAFLPDTSGWLEDDRPNPEQLDRALTVEERQQRWEVRAAQWRAHELATETFGPGVALSLIGLRHHGRLRGLLRLDVPFRDLDAHAEGEARFLAAVHQDPILTRVPLLYVVGPLED